MTVSDVNADHSTDKLQPIFVPAHLENVTVAEGQTATLLCRVYGDVSTRLQVCDSKTSSLLVPLIVCHGIDLQAPGTMFLALACYPSNLGFHVSLITSFDLNSA